MTQQRLPAAGTKTHIPSSSSSSSCRRRPPPPPTLTRGPAAARLSPFWLLLRRRRGPFAAVGAHAFVGCAPAAAAYAAACPPASATWRSRP